MRWPWRGALVEPTRRSAYALCNRELVVLEQLARDESVEDDDPAAEPEPERDARRRAHFVRTIDAALTAIDREDLDVDAPSLDQLLAVRERAVKR